MRPDQRAPARAPQPGTATRAEHTPSHCSTWNNRPGVGGRPIGVCGGGWVRWQSPWEAVAAGPVLRSGSARAPGMGRGCGGARATCGGEEPGGSRGAPARGWRAASERERMARVGGRRRRWRRAPSPLPRSVEGPDRHGAPGGRVTRGAGMGGGLAGLEWAGPAESVRRFGRAGGRPRRERARPGEGARKARPDAERGSGDPPGGGQKEG